MTAEERHLSDRERTVLLLAAEGLTDKEIAKHLNLSQRTIGTYWERMRSKLGPYSRTQLVAKFLRIESDADRADEGYRTLFSTWDEGIWIIDGEVKTIFANPSISSLLGVPLESLMREKGKSQLENLLGDKLATFLEAARQEPQTTETEVTRGDSTHWLKLRGFPVTDRRGAPTATVLLLQDTTLQRRVQVALDSCNSTLDFLAEHSRDFIARFDRSHACVEANASLTQHLGSHRDALIGRKLEELEQFQPSESWIHGIEECFSSRQPVSFLSTLAGSSMVTHMIVEPTLGSAAEQVVSLTKPA